MAKLFINPHIKRGHINKELQGHFSEHLGRCIYDGIYVDNDPNIPNVDGMRADIVEALKQIKIPVLRWPGGCFADIYHWKKGIGSREERGKTINSLWGDVIENNHFGTDEYMNLCSQLDCKTYISGNMGSGTVEEMSEWIEYMTQEGTSDMGALRVKNGHTAPYRVDYFGVGNESWGGGGNMTAAYYADEYRKYQTYLKNYNKDVTMSRIAVGAPDERIDWTEQVLEEAYKDTPPNTHGFMDGLSVHYYTIPGTWENKGSAIDFTEEEWYETMRKTTVMERIIKMHGQIMDKYDPEKKIGMVIDEWGTWLAPEPGTNPAFLYQQNTIRDALVAGINLNIFNKNCDRVKMANIAQTVNVLQSLILTNGKEMLLTPTYHAFDLYKVHQDSTLLDSNIETCCIGTEKEQVVNLTESVSEDKDGVINITITNQSLDQTYNIETIFMDYQVEKVHGRILTGKMNAHNTFDDKNQVITAEYQDITVENNKILFAIPPRSIILLQCRK